MKLSKHLRAAAALVANNPRYNSMCARFGDTGPIGMAEWNPPGGQHGGQGPEPPQREILR